MQTSNVDGIWSDDPCPAVKEVYIVRGQRLAIQPLEPADFGAHIVAQNLPVERALGASPAKPFAVSRVLGELGAVDEHLLWHARIVRGAGREGECQCVSIAVVAGVLQKTHAQSK